MATKNGRCNVYSLCEEPLLASNHAPTTPNKKGPKTAAACKRQEADNSALLNVQPTLWFAFPVFLVASATAAFLEVYVVESIVAHMAVFAIGSYVVFASYFVCDFHMTRLSSSYTKIPDEKKFYVLSNLIKAAVLLSYTPLAALTLYRALVRRAAKLHARKHGSGRDEWNTQRIRNLGVLYAIPDFVSLFLVSRMAFSTKLHHICVVIFMVANLFNDYSDDGVGRALVVYAVFSTFAYLVNLLLASRFLQVNARMALAMSVVALVVYGSCLCINWLWQLRYVLGRWYATDTTGRLALAVYLSFIAMVVYDDLVLVSWLRQNMKRKLKAQ